MLVVVRGGGDLGTGVVYHLVKSGIPTLITELTHPRMVRHTVCLGAAAYQGSQSVEDMQSRLVSLSEVLDEFPRDFVPVVHDEQDQAIPALRPEVVIDCRMLKYAVPDVRRLAPLAIGLGPGFMAASRWGEWEEAEPEGSASVSRTDISAPSEVAPTSEDAGDSGAPEANVDFVIETQRGATLGRIISRGMAIPNTGVPGVIGGESIRRLIKAPKAGTFRGVRQVGEIVEAGDVVGYVDEVPVRVIIGGRLRGLVHDGLVVRDKEKIGDCDPRGEAVSAFKISDKSHCLGRSAANIVTRFAPALEKLGKG